MSFIVCPFCNIHVHVCFCGSMEPGVLTLYAVAEKDAPHKITILEIYADRAAYESHLKTPHFQKYKQGTLDMVKELELVDTTPLIPGLKIK